MTYNRRSYFHETGKYATSNIYKRRQIEKSWKAISSEQILNSMKQCAITTNLDGSEDDSIHCFKSEGNEFGLQLLREERQKDMTVNLSDEEDEHFSCIVNDISDTSSYGSSWCDSDESN